MRTELGKECGKRKRWRATMKRFGRKAGYKGYLEGTVLLLDLQCVSEPSEILTDHVWVNLFKRFKEADLHAGDVIEFDARVTTYTKRKFDEDTNEFYHGMDYRLSYPSKIEKVGRNEALAIYDAESQEVLQGIKDHNDRLKESRKNFFEQREQKKEHELNIRTDCYLAVLKKYQENFPAAHFEVITRTKNHPLSPSNQLLTDYKHGLSWENYTFRFVNEMQNRSKQPVFEKLRQIAQRKILFLVCYEKNANRCHRSLVKQLLIDLTWKPPRKTTTQKTGLLKYF